VQCEIGQTRMCMGAVELITILTGAPGHGKSYTSVRMIDEFVHGGKYVVTNVPLRSDFATQMAIHHTILGRFRKNKVAEKAAMYHSRVHICTEIDDIVRVRFEGKGEGRGQVVIDESHRVMNVRGSTRGASEEAKQRKAVVAYVSAHRHYGADVTLITQAFSNIDVQIRNLFEFHSEVRNFRRLPFLGWLARLFPGGNLFLRTTVWNDRAKTKAGIAVYGLSKRLANLYNTHALEEGDWPDDAIILPRSAEDLRKQIEWEESGKGGKHPGSENGKDDTSNGHLDPLAIGTVYRMPNGQVATVSTHNKQKLEKARDKKLSVGPKEKFTL
jgi:Zonular occludens toxin (Zot)